MNSTRDSYRHLMYAAEDAVGRMWDRDVAGPVTVDFHGSQLVLPVQRRFGDLDSIQRFCDHVLIEEDGVGGVRVRQRRGVRRAHWEVPNVIALPDARWAMREMPVLHELAHHIVWQRQLPDPGHGAEFAATYLDLLGRVTGPELRLVMLSMLDNLGYPLTHRRTA